MINVTRTPHAFDKHPHNPLLKDGYVMGTTVLPTEKRDGYRMWYSKYLGDNVYRILYATSDDGMKWKTRELGPSNRVNPQVIDTPWEQDPRRRYKLIYVAPDEARDAKYYGACSLDGINWTPAKNDPILAWPRSDVGNFVWDPHTERYIGYPKMWITVHGTEENPNRRSVGFSATKTFESWPLTPEGHSDLKVALVPDYIDDKWAKGSQRTEFYGLCGFAYESMYLGFLWIFRVSDDCHDVHGCNDGHIFIELVTSHDGLNWRRQADPRRPILPLTPGAWDGGMVFTTNHPLVEVKDGTIKLYYGGAALTHNNENNSWAIGLATLRKHGFASLDAEGPGSVLTRKCLGMEGRLRVNCKTYHGGSLRAEVLDASGNVMDGYGKDECNELKGDLLDAVVTWKDKKKLPETKDPLQIRFLLQDASLYSFAAGDSVNVKVLSFDSGVLYTFEGDAGKSTAQNKLCPGEQDGRLLNNVKSRG